MNDLLENGGTPPVVDTAPKAPVVTQEVSHAPEQGDDATERVKHLKERIDDLEKEVGGLEDNNLKLKRHNKQLLTENADIARLYKEKCEEDGEVYDMGIQADEERKKLKEQVKEVAEVLQTKPERKAMINKIMELQDAQRKLLAEASGFFQNLFKRGGDNT